MGFDISINEVFLPLVCGARLVVAEPGGERDIEYLLEVIERERVTFTYLVSSMLDLLVELPGVTTRTRELKHVWCGGEALGQGLFDRFQARLNAVLYHGYGPAEATIGVTHQFYQPGQRRDGVTIGRPNPNTRIYLLDHCLRPVPVGVTGELYTGGLPLGRGYVNDPAQTASRFVADPFTPGQRLYRTGDLAQWRPDGVLEFHGRADNQIKIRGMRVELEEIEAVLGQHPHIRQAVVTTDTTPIGITRLLGYYLPTHDHLDHTELRTWTATRLPEHMVPTTFISLDTLPLTPNGKINRQKLPAPSFDRGQGYTEFALPQGAEEMMVAEVWKEVLGLDRVGRNDNFFELGGDSLLGARMVLWLREVSQLQISLRELFRLQTVSGLASVLAPAERTSSAAAQSGQMPAPRARGQQPQEFPPWPEFLPPLTAHCGDNVLLTGASGFFGAFLLRAILTRYSGKVHCLVRANSTTQAWEKLRANLERYELSVPQDRIRVIVGDLARPSLGLGDNEFERLADEIDLIIHNGAHVDILHTYETIEAANVGGTRTLLWLATTTWRKPLRFVSTSSLASYRPSESGTRSGYLESKWQAEQVVAEARARGIPAAVYRIPRLSPDSHTGRGNDRDIMFRTIRWILDLGMAPGDISISEDWIPVDEAARLLVDSYPGPEHGGSFVLTAQRQVHLAEVVELARQNGHEIEYKPTLEWGRELARRSVEEYEVMASALRINSAGSAPDAGMPVPRDSASLDDGFVPVVARGVTEQILRRYLHTMSPSRRTS
jgi:thioester reductase-like protein